MAYGLIACTAAGTLVGLDIYYRIKVCVLNYVLHMIIELIRYITYFSRVVPFSILLHFYEYVKQST